MEPLKKPNPRIGPEAKIQSEIEFALRGREWYVKSTHGNMYQSGFPDIYAYHKKHGQRWIEVKYKEHYVFTPAQLENFPMMSAFGIGIWILVSADQNELQKLFQPPNWHLYL